MTEGFYINKEKVCYGKYYSDQVSGFVKISKAGYKIDESCKFLPEDDRANLFHDNHGATTHELRDFTLAIGKVCEALYGKTCSFDTDYKTVEQLADMELPDEIKSLYAVLDNKTDLLANKFTGGKERFLSSKEIYTDNDILVFYKIKSTPVGINLNSRQLMNYYKKQWICSLGNVSFCNYVLERMNIHAISNMSSITSGNVKGELKSAFNPENILKINYKNLLNILDEYSNYGNIIMYNTDGALAWFRQNGFKADMLLGCNNNALEQKIVNVKCDISWNK